MIYAADVIMKGVIKLLSTDNTVQEPTGTVIDIYGEVPNNAKTPFVIIQPSDMSETDGTKDSIPQSLSLNVEVLDKHPSGLGGFGRSNRIMSGVLSLIRQKGVTIDISADGLRVYKQVITSINHLKEQYDDSDYYRTIANIEFSVQEI